MGLKVDQGSLKAALHALKRLVCPGRVVLVGVHPDGETLVGPFQCRLTLKRVCAEEGPGCEESLMVKIAHTARRDVWMADTQDRIDHGLIIARIFRGQCSRWRTVRRLVVVMHRIHYVRAA